MDWKKIWEFVVQTVTSLGMKLLIGALILVVGIFVIKRLKKFFKYSKKLAKVEQGIRTFLASFISIALYILLFITLASVVGIPVTSFLTVLASCGVAIGLALQGSLSNFAGGVMLLFFKPFKVGDYIEVSGEEGTVAEISVVYTVIMTNDNKRITLPNGALTNSVIKNYTAEDKRRVDLVFTTAYSCDIEKTKALIIDIANEHPLTIKEPEPFVRLSKHGDSSLEYTLRVWCKTGDYWSVHFDIIEKVKREFDANGIEIPFPQMDIHVRNEK